MFKTAVHHGRDVVLIIAWVASAALIVHTTSNDNPDVWRPDDQKAIRATIEAYRSAWLANDKQAVLNTFTDDAVLLPAQGGSPVVGIAAITSYWFTPGGPATTVTRLDISVDQVSGNSTLAFVRGSDNVGWTVTQDGVTRRHYHPGTYLNVMKKLPDGSWRIQAHMWDDGPETVELTGSGATSPEQVILQSE